MQDDTPRDAEAPGTLAVIRSSNEPLLLLSTDQKVIMASTSFCRAFGIDPSSVVGKSVSELDAGEWAMPRLVSLLKATASGNAQVEAYEIDLKRQNQSTRKLVLNARILVDDGSDRARLLLAVTDVTDVRAAARLQDDLIRDNAILVQEVQHRVANSLQIIASILMMSARRVQSEEARGHLTNAHQRVMSLAEVQKQLSASQEKKVALRPYLAQLSESLGASMIADGDRLTISVLADDSVVEAQVSVNLGLIVTELVINSLKHAFPEQQPGKIVIDYESTGSDWTLTVSDDGIGVATGESAPAAGLGTSIIEALSKNMGAHVELSDAHPGTTVTITGRTETGTDLSTAPDGSEPGH